MGESKISIYNKCRNLFPFNRALCKRDPISLSLTFPAWTNIEVYLYRFFLRVDTPTCSSYLVISQNHLPSLLRLTVAENTHLYITVMMCTKIKMVGISIICYVVR